MKKKIKNKCNLPVLKKNIKEFLLSEEGKITKKDIAKIGMSLSALSLMFPSQVAAQVVHTNFFFSEGTGGHTSHSSHGSHSSHTSHSSHAHGAF